MDGETLNGGTISALSTMTDLCTFEEITPNSGAAVGGKGLSLGLMARAGLPVPDGFCLTTAAYLRHKGRSPRGDTTLSESIVEAYRRLGAGLVAVRSSATAEDGAVTSFAGQQETILGVQGEEALFDAIDRCWASLDSERAIAYRRQQGVREEGLGMAVVVQRLVPAEVAGVLFTRDPLDVQGKRMLIEASWGLGESVVSGRVTPDRYHIEHETGVVLDRHIGTKATRWTPSGPAQVDADKQNQPCLNPEQLVELAELGRRVEAFYGEARDVEWAWSEGHFWLLQARPITTGGAFEREQVRLEEIAALQARAEPSGTVWSRYNLSEILREPTPMTWAIVRRFMSGKGGFGLMYRDLGFDPDAALNDEGIYDLVCGRPYCNLSREPLMQYRNLPYEHPFATLKAEPHKALYPQPVLNPARAGWRFWLKLPVVFIQLLRGEARRNSLAATFAATFREQILPRYLQTLSTRANVSLSALDGAALLAHLEGVIQTTLIDFARDSLKPTALAGVMLGKLQQSLTRLLGPEKAGAATGALIMGVRSDPDTDLPAALRDLAAGRISREAFLERFGHRGSHEMELGQPRWSEDPGAVDRLIAQARQRNPHESATGEPVADSSVILRDVPDAQRRDVEKDVQTLHTHLMLRETAKHYLLLGYALVRRVLLELDRRNHLGGGVFYLTPDDLPRLVSGEDLSALIAARRRRRTLALSLEVPPVLFSDDLEAIGRPVSIAGADMLQGVPLSAGVAEGPALVLCEPTAAVLPEEPYILVCPSTDPAWVPLFERARGLVMETGGVLSHGAIVAREFGLPAAAGLPGVLRRIQTGQRLRVDGGSGIVTVLP
jgi:pyruvate,water dikinase